MDSQDAEAAKKKKVKIGIGVLCLVVAAASLYYNFGGGQTFRVDQRLYSDDDGKTWYADSSNNIPPYEHNGKTAYGAVVMSYAGGKKQFCAYLLRFPEQVRNQILQNAKNGASKTPPVTAGSVWGTETALALEVKAPGKPGPWVPMSSKEAKAIVDVHSPDGSELDTVVP